MPSRSRPALPHSASEQILRASVINSASNADWSTIDWVQAGEAAQLTKSKRMRRSRQGEHHDVEAMFSASQGWLAAVVAGVLMGLIAVAIEIGTLFVSSIRIGVCQNYFWLNKELCCPATEGGCPGFVTWGELFGGEDGRHRAITDCFMYVLLGTFFAGTASFFCRHYAMYAAGGGINEVKTVVSGHVVSRYFNRWVMFVKGIGVCMSTGSGLAVGKEGPFVHLGACCADTVGALFPAFQNGGKRRELIAAGAGGGLAVAFGAPIGGVVFAIEEISSFFSFKSMMQALMCGVAAVLVVKNFDTMHTGRIVQFSIDYRHRWHWFELPAFALLGAFGGLVGSLYNKCNIAQIKFRKGSALKDWPITEVIVLAIVSNLINFAVPLCKGGMLELLAQLFQDCPKDSEIELCTMSDLGLMFALIVAGCFKCCLSFMTVGSCVPAGLLVPSLVIGGLFGRAYGIFFSAMQQQYSNSVLFQECRGLNLCVIPGAYAIVGAAAVLTGVTRMTVCLAVIMFELTGGLEYLVPVIVAILMSKWCGEAVGVDSIYELGIELTNLPYLDPKKEFPHDNVASEIYRDKKFAVLFATGMTVDKINEVLEHHTVKGFPLVTSPTDNTLHGYVRRSALIDALHNTARTRLRDVTSNTVVSFCGVPGVPQDPNDLDYSSYVDDSVLQVSPECSVPRLLYMFKSLGSRTVMVTRFSRFEGLVTKKDLIQFMRKIEHEEHEEEESLAHDS